MQPGFSIARRISLCACANRSNICKTRREPPEISLSGRLGSMIARRSNLLAWYTRLRDPRNTSYNTLEGIVGLVGGNTYFEEVARRPHHYPRLLYIELVAVEIKKAHEYLA